MPEQRVAWLETSGRDKASCPLARRPPDQVVGRDVERVAGLCVHSEHRLNAVRLGGDDPGESEGVVDLGAHRVIVDKFADRDQPGRRADQSAVRLARADLLRGGGADVEPDGRVKGEDLVDQGVLELVVEDLRVLVGGEVTLLPAGGRVDVGHPVDELLQRPLALRRAHRAAEVLGGHDVGGVDRPGVGELDPVLLEVDRAVPPVGHHDIAALPRDLVVRVHARRGVDAADLQAALALAPALARSRTAHRFRHDCLAPFSASFVTSS